MWMNLRLLLALSTLSCCISQETDTDKVVPKPIFQIPTIPDDSYLALYFESPEDLQDKLVLSKAKKEGVDESLAKYDGIWSVEVSDKSAVQNDYVLILKSKAKHHAISTKLQRVFKFTDGVFVMQYEVKFVNGLECGGAYVKLLSDSDTLDLSQFTDKTPYTIMFGPDKCGQTKKMHFILRHKNPVTGDIEEKHMKSQPTDLDRYFTSGKSHLYTLVLRSENTFEIYIDQTLVTSGNLLTDFDPPINPPSEIDDPEDKKPKDWDDLPKIVDQDAKKPADWDEDAVEFVVDESATKPEGWLDDEPALSPDPDAEKPKDWDEEMDGDWEAPKIDNPACKTAPGCGEWQKPRIKNPAYKGKWSAPLIDNPNYKGVWKPKKIPNPGYFEDDAPYKMVPIAAVGLELWSMTDEIVFDNFFISSSKASADEFAAQTWIVKRDAERVADPSARSVVDFLRENFTERPWIMALIGLTVCIPLVICCYCLCRSSPDEAAVTKKTDIPVPDDKSHSDDEKEVDEDDEEQEDQEGEDKETAVEDQENTSGEEETEDVGVRGENAKVTKRKVRKD